MKTNTINAYKVALSDCFKTAVINRLIPFSPVIGAPVPSANPSKEKRSLTSEEMKVVKAVGAEEKTPEARLVITMLYTGARFGETCA